MNPDLLLWRCFVGGACRTTLIANIWGDTVHLDETAATLRFATRIGKILNEARRNNLADGEGASRGTNARYEAALRRKDREIAELRAELAMYDLASHRAPEHNARALPPAALAELREGVRAILEGPTTTSEPVLE